MKLSDFQDQYHWMNGLSEYFKFTGQEERWEHIHKALYHDNWYRKRDVLADLVNMGKSNPQHVRAWMNVLLHEHLEDVELKPQLLATLFRKYMEEDEFLVNVCKFVNYWAGNDGEAAEMPDMNDFLSRGQVRSKLWLVSELAKVVEGDIGNVVFYGGWYNFMAHFLFNQFEVDRIYSLDLDENVIVPSKRLYSKEVEEYRFIPMQADVNKLLWRDEDKTLWRIDHDKREQQINEWMEKQEQKFQEKYQSSIDEWMEKQEKRYQQILIEKEAEIVQGYTTKEKVRQDLFVDKDSVFETISNDLRNGLFKDKEETFETFGYRKIDKINMVINTSCEHMDNTWFENLPSGTFVVLHQNDYFENEQHVNCCKDLEDVKRKYPMQNIFYEGELDTHLYNRFMLIGIK